MESCVHHSLVLSVSGPNTGSGRWIGFISNGAVSSLSFLESAPFGSSAPFAHKAASSGCHHSLCDAGQVFNLTYSSVSSSEK